MPLLLLTRPHPASMRFADEAAGLGLRTIISPILKIVAVDHDEGPITAAEGLVFTSENAVPFAGEGRGRQAICVGPRTSAAAEAAGFDAVAGPGDAARLMPMLEGLGPEWLHVHGVHRAAVLPVRGIAVYDQIAVPLTDEARVALAGDVPILLPIFSPRTAKLLSIEAKGARAPLWIAPISEAAYSKWEGPVAGHFIARTPDSRGVMAVLSRLLDERIKSLDRVETKETGV